VGVELNRRNGSSLIRLGGAIDIGGAAALKAALLEAIASGDPIRVSVDAVSELDVTAYQLLWAAAREAERSGLILSLAGEIPEPLRSALSEMGLDPCAFLTDACAESAGSAGR
jgi:anti-anti-sigma regulatory factor